MFKQQLSEKSVIYSFILYRIFFFLQNSGTFFYSGCALHSAHTHMHVYQCVSRGRVGFRPYVGECVDVCVGIHWSYFGTIFYYYYTGGVPRGAGRHATHSALGTSFKGFPPPCTSRTYPHYIIYSTPTHQLPPTPTTPPTSTPRLLTFHHLPRLHHPLYTYSPTTTTYPHYIIYSTPTHLPPPTPSPTPTTTFTPHLLTITTYPHYIIYSKPTHLLSFPPPKHTSHPLYTDCHLLHHTYSSIPLSSSCPPTTSNPPRPCSSSSTAFYSTIQYSTVCISSPPPPILPTLLVHLKGK